MPKGKNQKFKLYRLAQIMLENTDEEHYITMSEIKEKLEEYEVTADRKSIYNDLKDLEKLARCREFQENFMKQPTWMARQDSRSYLRLQFQVLRIQSLSQDF